MFGGGVEPGEPDPQHPIRGTTIRGQLQFWWRATRGADCQSRNELFDRHTVVWGTTDKASPVEIEVSEVEIPSPPQSCAAYKWSPRAQGSRGGWRLDWEQPFQNNELPYALFPFQGKPPAAEPQAQSEELPATCITQCRFILRMRFPEELRQDVEAAVWAWVNFGGLGARTRRGCGSLFCDDLAPPSEKVSDLTTWFQQGAGSGESIVREWPILSSRFLYLPDPASPVDAWNQAINLLKNFRQGEGLGRNPGQQKGRPGRSRWPEAETIRKVTHQRSGKHQRLTYIPDDAFPRAEFGLPIVFHFKDVRQGDPVDTVIYPAPRADGSKLERMASPLILKPLALTAEKSVALILRLVTPPLTGVDLYKGSGSLGLPSTTTIRDPRLAVYDNSPLSGTESGSAVEALLALAKKSTNGFTEVSR